jgi:hypothetical protein
VDELLNPDERAALPDSTLVRGQQVSGESAQVERGFAGWPYLDYGLAGSDVPADGRYLPGPQHHHPQWRGW